MSFFGWLLLIILIIFLCIFLFDIFTRKWLEWSQFNFLIGKPGSGKSVFLTKIAAKSFSQGLHVFSSEPIRVVLRNPRIPRILRIPYKILYKSSRKFRERHPDEKIVLESVQIDPKALWRYQFPKKSVVLVDEIGSLFQNRRYKEFDPKLVDYFKRYRHDQVTFWVASQSMDCDIVIRRIVSRYWLLSKKVRLWSVATRLICTPRKVSGAPGMPSTIEDDFVEDPKLMKPLVGGSMIAFIPHWAKMYDSYEIPPEQMERRDIDLSDLPVPIEQAQILAEPISP